jgi:endonuclease YncB( thermonuclease family)
MSRRSTLFVCGGLLFALALVLSAPGATRADIVSYAIVQKDGSLRVSGRTIRLFGIYIPPTGRFCQTKLRPSRCGQRAVLALDFRAHGFVRCRKQWRNNDGSITAVCWVDGQGSVLDDPEDLGAWMLRQGWALALPDAPFEYHALERIARAHHRGVWGFQVDSIR